MKKRVGVIIGLLLVSVLGLLVWQASGPREPIFEGRSLSSWLDHHVAASDAKPPYNSPGWQKADQVLRTIGSNAVPTLVRMARAKDPPAFALKLLEFARRHGLTRVNYRYAAARHREAEYAFQVLGANAVSAVPDLIKIYEEDISPASQSCAASALGHIGRGAQPALPALIRRFNHTNSEVRFSAVSAVMRIGGEPGIVIPALTSALQDSSVNVRWNALVGLSMFGERARPVVPEILKMLSDPGMVGSSSITSQVEIALWRIAPEKVGKPLVVEEATPMIRNGVTTAALKMILSGERKTLISPGKSVPAVAQYWNSDPRPFLTLFRGSLGSEGEDHLLGRFEVQGLPAADNLNVSTLCVVANGQIILCARDNQQEQFLEIRRMADEAIK